jgi:hypothetical protein
VQPRLHISAEGPYIFLGLITWKGALVPVKRYCTRIVLLENNIKIDNGSYMQVIRNGKF